MTFSRRQFLASLSLGTAALAGGVPATSGQALASALPPTTPVFSCNSYSWLTFYNRAGKQWMQDPDASLRDYVAAGFTAYEPSVESPEHAQSLGPLLKKYGLAMPSIYVNSSLHDPDEAETSMQTALAIAAAVRPLGTRLIVTNPNPIRWGSGENKSDAQLEEQLRNLDRLGAELKQRGQTLAYHTHAPEHRAGAREFHHMMVGSNPDHVSLCLDAHWVYRGSENSQVALFDVVKLYGKRMASMHVRQSSGGIFVETFSPSGDIDYNRLAGTLKAMNVRPLVVLEQCLENDSPYTMNAVAAHKADLIAAKTVFA